MIQTITFNFIALLSASLSIYIFILILSFFLVVFTKNRVFWNEQEKNSFRIGIIASLPIGISAIVLGFLSGLSFEPSSSALITGVISLISGAAVYLFGKERDSFISIIISILSFSLNLLAGATLGSEIRDRTLAASAIAARNRLLEDAIKTSIIEFRTRNFRINLGLDPGINHLGITNPPSIGQKK